MTILIYEMDENKISFMVILIIVNNCRCNVTLLVVFRKTFTLKRYFYMLPIVPFFYAWNGQASMPGMYSFNDVKEGLLSQQNNQCFRRLV